MTLLEQILSGMGYRGRALELASREGTTMSEETYHDEFCEILLGTPGCGCAERERDEAMQHETKTCPKGHNYIEETGYGCPRCERERNAVAAKPCEHSIATDIVQQSDNNPKALNVTCSDCGIQGELTLDPPAVVWSDHYAMLRADYVPPLDPQSAVENVMKQARNVLEAPKAEFNMHYKDCGNKNDPPLPVDELCPFCYPEELSFRPRGKKVPEPWSPETVAKAGAIVWTLIGAALVASNVFLGTSQHLAVATCCVVAQLWAATGMILERMKRP